MANLIDNALHYNHEHGHIDVATTGHGRVQLSVANSGLVIAQDQVEQLFRPFGVLFVVGCASHLFAPMRLGTRVRLVVRRAP